MNPSDKMQMTPPLNPLATHHTAATGAGGFRSYHLGDSPQTLIQSASRHVEEICRHLLPRGEIVGSTWRVRSFSGEAGQSLQITLSGSDKAGHWRACVSGGASGTNMIEVWSRASGVTFDQAATELAAWLEERALPDPATPAAMESLNARPEESNVQSVPSRRPSAESIPTAVPPISATHQLDAETKTGTMRVPLSAISTDGSTQTRAAMNAETAQEYADAMTAGTEFPAVVVFRQGSQLWMADGFHRYSAAQQIGREDILADVRLGTRIDALRYALAANTTNGLRRTNEDKRNCVQIAVKEFSGQSDRVIAGMCAVTHPFVAEVRRQLVTVTSSSGATTAHEPTRTTTTRVGKDGRARKSPQSKRQAKRPASGAGCDATERAIFTHIRFDAQTGETQITEVRPEERIGSRVELIVDLKGASNLADVLRKLVKHALRAPTMPQGGGSAA